MKTNTLILFFGLLFLLKIPAQNVSPEEKKLEYARKLLENYQLDSAEVQLKELSKPELAKHQPKIYIRTELNLGRLYGDKGENVNALQHYQKALKTAETTNDKESLAHVLKNIGVLYVSWKKLDEAFAYYEKSEHLAREIGDKELIADCQNNKGIVYEQKKEYAKALISYKNALELYTEKDIPGKISMALSNIAIVYKFQKNYPEAISYNFKAITIAEKQNDKWNMAATYNNIGNLYGEMGDYNKAIEYCEKALKIAKEIDAGEIIESTYDSMAEAAVKAGDYKKAYEYQKLFSTAMNDFINKENTRQLSELNVKYETEKKQNLINNQKFEIRQKNNWLRFVGILFLISIIAAYFVYKNYQHSQNRKLQEEIFRRKEVEAKALFDGEQNERIRIARDLHDSVGQMLSLIKMNISAQEKNTESEKIQNLIDKTISEVRMISHNLIPEELNFGLITALENLADKINTTDKTKMELEIHENVRSVKFQKQNQLSIYRIVQEILNNITKHSGATLIQLSVERSDDYVLFNISDNGKGLDLDSIANSSGIGWKNINARIHMMDGYLNIQSQSLKGTQIEITLPDNG
ncbi:sensor histidine kinase [Chryseobacterium culicis]|nr:tetratricopeptide repeat protein [Chryseobacterium culicis]MBE4948244.1 sensor histidine kinase [Chryseobacterium culicis]